MRRERFGFWGAAWEGDDARLSLGFLLDFVSGECEGLGRLGEFAGEEDENEGDVVVVAIAAGRLRLRLGCKRRARGVRGLSNFRLGKYFCGNRS